MVWQQQAVLGITASVFLRFRQPKRATDEGCFHPHVCRPPPPPIMCIRKTRVVYETFHLNVVLLFSLQTRQPVSFVVWITFYFVFFLISRAQSRHSGTNFLTSSSIKTLFVPRLCVFKLLSSCGGKSFGASLLDHISPKSWFVKRFVVVFFSPPPPPPLPLTLTK